MGKKMANFHNRVTDQRETRQSEDTYLFQSLVLSFRCMSRMPVLFNNQSL